MNQSANQACADLHRGQHVGTGVDCNFLRNVIISAGAVRLVSPAFQETRAAHGECEHSRRKSGMKLAARNVPQSLGIYLAFNSAGAILYNSFDLFVWVALSNECSRSVWKAWNVYSSREHVTNMFVHTLDRR